MMLLPDTTSAYAKETRNSEGQRRCRVREPQSFLSPYTLLKNGFSKCLGPTFARLLQHPNYGLWTREWEGGKSPLPWQCLDPKVVGFALSLSLSLLLAQSIYLVSLSTSNSNSIPHPPSISISRETLLLLLQTRWSNKGHKTNNALIGR